MRNKKIISFFVFIFYFAFINISAAEEIIFESPLIETFNNGNLIKANKGGKALIDNNTEIIADKFEYDKLKKILESKGNVKIIDNLNKIVTKSNKIIFYENQGKFFSEGKTIIDVDKKYHIISKNVNLLRNEQQISSNEFTIVVDDKEKTYNAERFRYFIETEVFRGSNVTIIDDNNDQYFFKDVLVNLKTNELDGKDLEVSFHNKMFGNTQNEPRLKGNKAFSNDSITTVSKGIFTTCKRRPNKKCPPWTVESKEAKHDKKKKTIYYKNAWLKVYNVPVLYYPYFFHPDPSVKRQSGFLTPQIGESQNLGTSAYIPYFYVISDSKDLTFKPRIFSDKLSLQSEYRNATKKSSHILDFSLTAGHDSSAKDKQDTRSHLFSNSIIDLETEFFDLTNLELQVQKTSNDTYLKLFDLESPLFGDGGSADANTSSGIDTLNSFINLTASREDLDFDASIKVYEKFDSANSDRYEFIFPNYTINKNLDTNLSGNLMLSSYGSQRIFNTNVKESHIINDLSYQSEEIYFTNGIKNDYFVLLKNVNTDGKNSSSYKNDIQSEMLSSLVLQSSYPLLREGLKFNNYLTPKLSLMYSPNKMKNLSGNDTRIDINNIFSKNRIASSETVESGQSLTIGAEYKQSRVKSDLPSDVFELSLATVFRDDINENIPTSSTIGNKSSNVVGRIQFEPNNYFNSKYNFSFDNNLDEIKYNELIANITVNNFLTSFKYIDERDNVDGKNYLQNYTSYSFDENNSIAFSTRRNKKIDMTEFYDLIYQYKNDCLTAAIKYNKEFYADGDIKPSEQLFFSLTIVPLGAYESKNLLIPK